MLITFLQKIFKNFFNLLFLLFFFFNILNDFKRILFIRKLFLQIFLYRLKGKNFYFLWLVLSGGYFVFLIVFFLILWLRNNIKFTYSINLYVLLLYLVEFYVVLYLKYWFSFNLIDGFSLKSVIFHKKSVIVYIF